MNFLFNFPESLQIGNGEVVDISVKAFGSINPLLYDVLRMSSNYYGHLGD